MQPPAERTDSAVERTAPEQPPLNLAEVTELTDDDENETIAMLVEKDVRSRQQEQRVELSSAASSPRSAPEIVETEVDPSDPREQGLSPSKATPVGSGRVNTRSASSTVAFRVPVPGTRVAIVYTHGEYHGTVFAPEGWNESEVLVGFDDGDSYSYAPEELKRTHESGHFFEVPEDHELFHFGCIRGTCAQRVADILVGKSTRGNSMKVNGVWVGKMNPIGKENLAAYEAFYEAERSGAHFRTFKFGMIVTVTDSNKCYVVVSVFPCRVSDQPAAKVRIRLAACLIPFDVVCAHMQDSTDSEQIARTEKEWHIFPMSKLQYVHFGGSGVVYEALERQRDVCPWKNLEVSSGSKVIQVVAVDYSSSNGAPWKLYKLVSGTRLLSSESIKGALRARQTSLADGVRPVADSDSVEDERSTCISTRSSKRGANDESGAASDIRASGKGGRDGRGRNSRGGRGSTDPKMPRWREQGPPRGSPPLPQQPLPKHPDPPMTNISASDSWVHGSSCFNRRLDEVSIQSAGMDNRVPHPGYMGVPPYVTPPARVTPPPTATPPPRVGPPPTATPLPPPVTPPQYARHAPQPSEPPATNPGGVQSVPSAQAQPRPSRMESSRGDSVHQQWQQQQQPFPQMGEWEDVQRRRMGVGMRHGCSCASCDGTGVGVRGYHAYCGGAPEFGVRNHGLGGMDGAQCMGGVYQQPCCWETMHTYPGNHMQMMQQPHLWCGGMMPSIPSTRLPAARLELMKRQELAGMKAAQAIEPTAVRAEMIAKLEVELAFI